MNSRRLLVIASVVVLLMGLAVSAGASAPPANRVGPGTQPGGSERGAVAAQTDVNPNEHDAAPLSDAEIEAQLAPDAIGPAYLVLPPAAFSSDGFDPDGFSQSFAGGYLVGRVASGACLSAPVNLPVGSTITGLQARVKDSNAGDSEWFDLYRINLSTGVAQELGSVTTPAGTTVGVVPYTDTTISQPVVSSLYAYQVTTCSRLNIFVYGVRIGYEFSTSLPLIKK